jgi:hypothetical protein
MVSFFHRVATVHSFQQYLGRTAELALLLANLLAGKEEKQDDDEEPADKAATGKCIRYRRSGLRTDPPHVQAQSSRAIIPEMTQQV